MTFAFDPTHNELLLRVSEEPYRLEYFEKASNLGIPKSLVSAFALHGISIQKELLARWQRDHELSLWEGSIRPDPVVEPDFKVVTHIPLVAPETRESRDSEPEPLFDGIKLASDY